MDPVAAGFSTGERRPPATLRALAVAASFEGLLSDVAEAGLDDLADSSTGTLEA